MKALSESAFGEHEQSPAHILSHISPVGIFRANATGECTFVNERWCEIAGLEGSAAEFSGWVKALHQDDRDRVLTEWAKCVASGGPFRAEYRFQRPDGQITWVLGQAAPEIGADGKTIGFVGTLTDITRLHEAEVEVQHLNRVYAVLSAISQMVVRVKNDDDLYSSACRIAVEKGQFLLAWIGLLDTSGTCLIPVVQHSFPAEQRSRLQALLDERHFCPITDAALKSGTHAVCNDIPNDAAMEPWRQPMQLLGCYSMASLPIKAGKTTMGTFNLYATEPGFFTLSELSLLDELAVEIGFALEVIRKETDRKQLEEQFRQAQKMEAIGRLAGGVAHDFNNILTVIKGHTSLLEATSGLPAEIQDSVREISLAATRASELTSQLLAYGRQQVVQPKNTDFNQVVSETNRLLHRVIGEQISLTERLQANLPFIKADPNILQQILINLAVNARDAMPQGGKLTIQTELRQIEPDFLSKHPEATSGQFVALIVTDTGSGISPEHMPHIFDPFFTTKEVGKGSGLGLASVYGMVKQHQGWITVESEVGLGTTFVLYFPISQLQPQNLGSHDVPMTRAPADMTLLIVEDETPVRKLTRMALERCGYQVLDAADGFSALEIWREQRDRITLVITDMVMPGGMSGMDLAAKLREEKPTVKVLFTSGYSREIFGQDLMLKEGMNFLPKPFRLVDLIAMVRHTIA